MTARHSAKKQKGKEEQEGEASNKKPQLNIQLEWEEAEAFQEIKQASGIDQKMWARAFVRVITRNWREARNLAPAIALLQSLGEAMPLSSVGAREVASDFEAAAKPPPPKS